MSRHKLGERIDNGDDRLSNHLTLHTIGHPQGTRSGHPSALRTECTPQLMFHIDNPFYFSIKKPFPPNSEKGFQYIQILCY
jgi:hypothetical protein